METEHRMSWFGRDLLRKTKHFLDQIKKARIPTVMNSHKAKPKALSTVN